MNKYEEWVKQNTIIIEEFTPRFKALDEEEKDITEKGRWMQYLGVDEIRNELSKLAKRHNALIKEYNGQSSLVYFNIFCKKL